MTSWLFDTDMWLHRRSLDPAVRYAARELFASHKPIAIASFSRLEFKATLLQDLVLLRHKVAESNSFKEAAARVQNSSGRKAARMLGQLMLLVTGGNLEDWPGSRSELCVAMDAEIGIAWEELAQIAESVADGIDCVRSREKPIFSSGAWECSIRRCSSIEPECNIETYLANFRGSLQKLSLIIEALPTDSATEELKRIGKVADSVVASSFSRGTPSCRSFGDLLIGLHALEHAGLVSSNRKEHSVLAPVLGYPLHEFPVASVRLK